MNANVAVAGTGGEGADQATDPVTLELIRGRLRSTQREMELIMERTAMSPFIREKKDYFAAFFDAGPQMIFGTNIPLAINLVDPVLAQFPIEDMRRGDVFAYNCPYVSKGAVTHTPDIVFVSPVFHDDEIVGFSECWAHMWDLGGLYPGTLSPESREIFHEGIRMPPVRLHAAGVLCDDVHRILLNNSRFPEILEGDTRALMAACQLGVERMEEILADFGAENVTNAFSAFIRQSRDAVRDRIERDIPDGSYYFTDWVDSDAATDTPVAIRVLLEKSGSTVRLDFTASDDQAEGPINYVMDATVAGVMVGAYMIADDPTLLMNQGLVQAIDDVVIRKGSVLDPHYPAPLGLRSHVWSRVGSAIMGVLNEATQGRANAASAPYGVYLIRGLDRATQKHWLCNEGIAVGFGARPFADGIDAVYFIGQKNYPGEFIEHEFPIRLLEYGIHKDSAGPGTYRGGAGVTRELQIEARRPSSRSASRR